MRNDETNKVNAREKQRALVAEGLVLGFLLFDTNENSVCLFFYCCVKRCDLGVRA